MLWVDDILPLPEARWGWEPSSLGLLQRWVGWGWGIPLATRTVLIRVSQVAEREGSAALDPGHQSGMAVL